MPVASLFSTRSRAPRRCHRRRRAVDDSSAKLPAVPLPGCSAPNEQRRCGSRLGSGAAAPPRRGELRQRTQVWLWRRGGAWMRSRGDAGDGDQACGDSTTSGTGTTGTYTCTASTTTTTDSAGEPAVAHAFSMPLPQQDKAKKLQQQVKGLVVEFRGDDMGMGAPAVERWLSELDVGWVLHLAGAGKHESSRRVVSSDGFPILAETWILALRKIGESILASLDGWYSQSQRQDQEDQDEGTSEQPSASEFAQLVQATVLKMLPFVDIAAAKTMGDLWPGEPAEKLQVLMGMHDALSMASQHILSLQVESTDAAMGDLLPAGLTKLDEAIWDTILEIMDNIMAWAWTHECGSNIHYVTLSIVSYTKVLWPNHGLVNRILYDAGLRGEYKPEKNENESHVSNFIMEMVSSLERKPSVTKSSSAPPSFLDESLRFLFLINNSYYLLQEFRTISRLDFSLVYLTHKIDDYIDSYLHVSWEPVFKCLEDPPTPCCFTRYSSPLSKFESKFQKTYAAQKLWKVQDPDMRRRLRKAIIDKVIPVFTQFLKDHSFATPRFTPWKLEQMLEELFEG